MDFEPWPYGCGSKIGTQTGFLVNFKWNQGLKRLPGGLVLTHGHMVFKASAHRLEGGPKPTWFGLD